MERTKRQLAGLMLTEPANLLNAGKDRVVRVGWRAGFGVEPTSE